jgi:hypothetical protein
LQERWHLIIDIEDFECNRMLKYNIRFLYKFSYKKQKSLGFEHKAWNDMPAQIWQLTESKLHEMI